MGHYGLLPQQVEDGASGVLVEGAPDAATALIRLLTDPPLAREVGPRGRDLVTRQHLITRLTGDYLRLFRRILTDGDDHRQPRLVDAFPDPSVGATRALHLGMMGQ